MPATSEFDLRFRVLGIPVRVTPWFWIFAALLSGRQDLRSLLIWVVCVFVSILIHELGHALMARAFGFWPSIALHGGYGVTDSQGEQQTPWQRLAVLICGPGAGFLTFGLLLGCSYAFQPRLSAVGERFYEDLMIINLVWSIFNLLPVIPLDGGQITGVVLSMLNRRNGARWAHVISLVTAGLIASYMFIHSQWWMTFIFAYFALINYQTLQALYQYSKQGDDSEWWRR